MVAGTGARAIEQPRAAVPAYVVKRLDRAVLVAQHEDALGAQIESLVIARPRDRVDMTDDLPAWHQHAFDFELGELRMAVNPGGQRTGTLSGDLGGGGVGVELRGGQAGHDCSPSPYMVIQSTRGWLAWQVAVQQNIVLKTALKIGLLGPYGVDAYERCIRLYSHINSPSRPDAQRARCHQNRGERHGQKTDQ